MKNIFLLILFTSTFTFSQNNLISIDTVINVDNTTKDVLYDRVHNFLTTGVKNQKQKEYLFKEENKEKGVIKVAGEFPNETKVFSGSNLVGQNVSYEYEVYFKDNKIRLIIESYNHPYFGTAIDELPYPEGSKPSMTSKKWYAKVYKEFIGNVYSVQKNIISNTHLAVVVKDKSEEEW
ncbi:Hypothetical protein I595_3295 [Croceitalea dokdonensis DOKDO 023]|uniref:DUF4468 domain-containing protein n=1 Tax=Croceitalea dokdonensis DOKDO 023 TaxID=1300341 RepID=A0A0P7AC49_9FLAO|nr:DUF4468 domain-containing protein [Croceitalea dokdonensis]KPM30798.1 Hypothetical protein I595_3295 [Croceitalea dokdonensis DOKDO 023]